jgi:hypothetical protein
LFVVLAVGGCATGVRDAGFGDAGPVNRNDDAGAGVSANGDDGGTGATGGDDSGIPEGGFFGHDSGPKDDSSCRKEATQAACIDCCQRVHAAGFKLLHDAAESCLCQSPGPCQSDCANEFCVNSHVTNGDACASCMDQNLASGAPCDAPVNGACNSDADCTAYIACFQPCMNKP